MTNPITEIKERTPVRLTMGQLFAGISTLVGTSVAATIMVTGSIHEVRDEVQAVVRTAETHTKQLDHLQLQLETLNTRTEAEYSKEFRWEWVAAEDIAALGDVIHTKTNTKAPQ